MFDLLFFSMFLFIVGLIGCSLNFKHILILIRYLEILVFACLIQFLIIGYFFQNTRSLIYIYFILIVSTIERILSLAFLLLRIPSSVISIPNRFKF